MNGDSSRMIAEIKTAINKGTLTHSEIERRLEAAIAAETNKEDSPADMEMVRACQSLLWELDTHGQEELADNTEQSLAAFKAKKAASAEGTRFALRTVAVAAAVLVLGFGIDALFRHEWLQGGSTDDEQQYVISGHEIDPGTVTEGKADGGSMKIQDVTTANLNEAVNVLGFMPAMPQWMPDGWKVFTYNVSASSSSRWFIITYISESQEYNMVYQIQYFNDAERALSAYEQNRTGDEIVLDDGRIVYVAENYDDTVCVWQEDLACYNLMGPESRNTCIKVVESVKEDS